MKKQLFQNYNFSFNKNDRKVLLTFCKQALRQMTGQDEFYNEVRIFNSIVDKLNTQTGEVKFTKDEKNRLVFNLKENVKNFEKELKRTKFIKKWLIKSALKNYNAILQKYFSE
ncbi:MAG: hypothetical protein JW866_07165 [Ignavibacteriales bacterium]|nr:hypothetical protein [Ignavibacteriales bacterium]